MMKPTFKIAITGGIGSGKSYFCRELERHGMKVYDCDFHAKRLMRSDRQLQEALRSLVGNEVYAEDGTLCKSVLAKFILQGEEQKQAVNAVVHPYVARDFMQSDYQWLESAILFESGFIRRIHVDHVVCVTAPAEVRLQRIMQRDNLSRHRAQQWIAAQMPQEEMLRLSDFEIVNDGVADVGMQTCRLLEALAINI